MPTSDDLISALIAQQQQQQQQQEQPSLWKRLLVTGLAAAAGGFGHPEAAQHIAQQQALRNKQEGQLNPLMKILLQNQLSKENMLLGKQTPQEVLPQQKTLWEKQAAQAEQEAATGKLMQGPVTEELERRGYGGGPTKRGVTQPELAPPTDLPGGVTVNKTPPSGSTYEGSWIPDQSAPGGMRWEPAAPGKPPEAARYQPAPAELSISGGKPTIKFPYEKSPQAEAADAAMKKQAEEAASPLGGQAVGTMAEMGAVQKQAEKVKAKIAQNPSMLGIENTWTRGLRESLGVMPVLESGFSTDLGILKQVLLRAMERGRVSDEDRRYFEANIFPSGRERGVDNFTAKLDSAISYAQDLIQQAQHFATTPKGQLGQSSQQQAPTGGGPRRVGRFTILEEK